MFDPGPPTPQEYVPYYGTYISLVPDGPIVSTLERQVGETVALLSGLSEAQAAHAYGPGKWTLKQVVGHLLDTERVFAYRLLGAARGDEGTPLPGFDEAGWARIWDVSRIPLPDLSAELGAIRTSTLFLLRHLGERDWERRVTANGVTFTARALAYTIAGHELHHRRILEERYLA